MKKIVKKKSVNHHNSGCYYSGRGLCKLYGSVHHYNEGQSKDGQQYGKKCLSEPGKR